MARIIKNGITEEASASNDAKVRQIVEDILTDIESNGDKAVRTLSEKFDNWSPDQFRLTDDQIQACVDALDESTRMISSSHKRKFATLLRSNAIP